MERSARSGFDEDLVRDTRVLVLVTATLANINVLDSISIAKLDVSGICLQVWREIGQQSIAE